MRQKQILFDPRCLGWRTAAPASCDLTGRCGDTPARCGLFGRYEGTPARWRFAGLPGYGFVHWPLAVSSWQGQAALFLVAGLALLTGLSLLRRLRQRARQRLLQARLVLVDPLTGLPSRVAAAQFLERKMAQVQQYEGSFAVLRIDIDAPAASNGPLEDGQEILLVQAAARRLAACVREQDLFARLDGKAFIAVIACSSEHQIRTAAARLHRALAQPLLINEHVLPVSLAIGISLYPQPGSTADSLLKQAEWAMQAAKDTCAGDAVFYTSAMASTADIAAPVPVEMVREKSY